MLHLRSLTISNDDIELISDGLQDYMFLTHLDLSYNRVSGSRGGTAIARIISRNMEEKGGLNLDYLNVSNNRLGEYGFTNILSELLNDDNKLQNLNIGYNNIDKYIMVVNLEKSTER